MVLGGLVSVREKMEADLANYRGCSNSPMRMRWLVVLVGWLQNAASWIPLAPIRDQQGSVVQLRSGAY